MRTRYEVCFCRAGKGPRDRTENLESEKKYAAKRNGGTVITTEDAHAMSAFVGVVRDEIEPTTLELEKKI